LHELKKSGFRIAIDDFGTGYSSLSLLQELPVDILKIDQYFVGNLTRGEKPRRILETIVKLGNDLKLQIIAEGVKTKRQITALRKIGCRFGQGNLFSAPMKLDEFESKLAKQIPFPEIIPSKGSRPFGQSSRT
ncbi:MAG: EAL domain-containing protein, partial [Acidobacteriota bacterium]